MYKLPRSRILQNQACLHEKIGQFFEVSVLRESTTVVSNFRRKPMCEWIVDTTMCINDSAIQASEVLLSHSVYIVDKYIL